MNYKIKTYSSTFNILLKLIDNKNKNNLIELS